MLRPKQVQNEKAIPAPNTTRNRAPTSLSDTAASAGTDQAAAASTNGCVMETDSWLKTNPRPRQKNMPANVTRKGGNSKKWIKLPIAPPRAVPQANMKNNATTGGQ